MHLKLQADWRRMALIVLIATHFAAAVFAVQTTVGLLGLQELPVFVPVVVGLLWGQAMLLGQFLVLGAMRVVLKLLLATSWFISVLYLGEPFFRATGGHDAFVACGIFLAMPFIFSALLAAGRWSSGVQITRYRGAWKHGDAEAFRFSLRALLMLTLLAAVALAGVRLARDTIEEPPQALLLGLIPAIEVFVLLPSLSLWAALGGKHPVLRSAVLILFGLACVVGPLFIGRAKPATYWMLVSPVVLPSVVVTGTLLIVRAIGYRYVAAPSTFGAPHVRQTRSVF